MAVLSFDRVSKCYFSAALARVGLKESLLRLPNRLLGRAESEQLWALRNVSLAVERGECFGVIGRNGSGKSTALSLMAGVMAPTSGTVHVECPVTPLLALGAGFHMELNGTENVMLNAVLMGLTRRQVRERMGAIVEFAELADAMHRPLRTYSSGMVARLGFAVAVNLTPELLLIDEVLAVGDIAFQTKCLAELHRLRASGVTIVIVSHDPASVQAMCDRVALIDHGSLVGVAPPTAALGSYAQRLSSPTSVEQA